MGVLLGTVVIFDERRGTGDIETTDGTRFPFHCTALVDGSRAVPIGASVAFVTTPGRIGRLEAAEVHVIPDVPVID